MTDRLTKTLLAILTVAALLNVFILSRVYDELPVIRGQLVAIQQNQR